MLSRAERAVMKAVYDKCHGTGSCLITLEELGDLLPPRKKMDANKLETIVRSLELDDYFDLIYSDRGGVPVMCINLHLKGQSYKREMVQFKRQIANKMLLAVLSAVATFVMGRILFFIFK